MSINLEVLKELKKKSEEDLALMDGPNLQILKLKY